MNRGSREGDFSQAGRDTRFNEAPIHESGKSGRGAPAARQDDAASMRPRFMNRGSIVRLSASAPTERLQ